MNCESGVEVPQSKRLSEIGEPPSLLMQPQIRAEVAVIAVAGWVATVGGAGSIHCLIAL
jgi:hypothetical protein